MVITEGGKMQSDNGKLDISKLLVSNICTRLLMLSLEMGSLSVKMGMLMMFWTHMCEYVELTNIIYSNMICAYLYM